MSPEGNEKKRLLRKKSANMLPEGNGSCFYIEKKYCIGKRNHWEWETTLRKHINKNQPVCCRRETAVVFILRKKGNEKKRLSFFILRMGNRMETHSLRIANKVWTKNQPVCCRSQKNRQYAKLYREKISRRETHSLRIANKVWTKNQPVSPVSYYSYPTPNKFLR